MQVKAKYKIGQKVVASPLKKQSLSVRDSDISRYAGQNCVVTDYYWIRPRAGEVFFIYTLQVEGSHEEVVLYEDEIKAF